MMELNYIEKRLIKHFRCINFELYLQYSDQSLIDRIYDQMVRLIIQQTVKIIETQHVLPEDQINIEKYLYDLAYIKDTL